MCVRKAVWSRVTLAAVVVGAMAVARVGGVAAQVASDREAGYIVFPKVVVDTAGTVFGNGKRIDTLIQLTNTDSVPPNDTGSPHRLHCFWVNTSSCCGGPCNRQTNTNVCDPNSPTACNGVAPCVQGWYHQTDFDILLTAGQPIAFLASSGIGTLPCDLTNQQNGCTGIADGAVSGTGSPFVGELKCVEVATNETSTTSVPIPRNDLQGSARLYTVGSGSDANSIDVRQYNAVGFPVPSGTTAFDDSTAARTSALCLGQLNAPYSTGECPQQEYAACPDTLILNHFFENAQPFQTGESVGTTLTLVPCTEDILNDTGANIRVQLGIFNEFEQRFSSSTTVNCYRSTRLADIDTRVGSSDDGLSIFSAAVQGTLTGQTRIRGVPADSDLHGLIGIAEEGFSASAGPRTFSDAFNLQYDKSKVRLGDIVRIP